MRRYSGFAEAGFLVCFVDGAMVKKITVVERNDNSGSLREKGAGDSPPRSLGQLRDLSNHHGFLGAFL